MRQLWLFIGLFTVVTLGVQCRTAERDDMPSNDTTSSGDLEIYRWKNRLVLICAPSRNSTPYRRQKDLLAGKQEEMQDRDIVVIELLMTGESKIGPSPLTMDQQVHMRADYAVPSDGFQFILVGKDGGVKLRAGQPVKPEDLFELVDSMPMRQEEIRRRANYP